MIIRALVCLLMLCVAPAARADELRPGYLDLTEVTPQQWRMTWKGPLRSGLAGRATPVVPEGCSVGTPQRTVDDVALKVIWPMRCSQPLGGKEIKINGLDNTIADALVRVAPLDAAVQTGRLTPQQTSFQVLEKASRWDVASAYFVIGVEHILLGFDHLFFVLALVFLLTGWRSILGAVTAFTVAHSITLVGTTLGFLGLPQKPVESVIALSIVFLAVEIVKSRPGELRFSQRAPWLVAFSFGLLHGFGFAGALKEIGLPEGEVPMALLTFNLGVEAGQVFIVALALGILALIRRFWMPAARPITLAMAYFIGSLASYWFIERTLV